MASSYTSRRRSSSFEEDIIIKPSSELIPDEYEHFVESTNRILVYTFSTDDKEHNSERFIKTLDNIGLIFERENYSLERDNCLEILDNVTQKNCDNIDGLILYFFGYSVQSGSIVMSNGSEEIDVNLEEIWIKFNSYNCVQLKNKPKMFLFDISSFSSVQIDGHRHTTISYELAYDTPGEADMLIIYNKIPDHDKGEFMNSLSKSIETYSNHEDIISIITISSSEYCQPIIISTLTRKFYFTASEARGYHLTMKQNGQEIGKQIDEVKCTLTAITARQ